MDEIAAMVRERQETDRVKKEQRGTGSGRRRRTARGFRLLCAPLCDLWTIGGEGTAEGRGDLSVKIMGGYWEMTDH